MSAEIWIRSGLPNTEVFNVCDGLTGLTGLTGADELRRLTVRLWPTAHRFRCGRRIRVVLLPVRAAARAH